LLAYKVRVEKALEAVAEALTIAQNCLVNREARRGIDLTHDDVQKELMKEVEVLQGVMEMLKRTHEEVVEQVRLNRRALFNLEKDLADKFQGLSIDEYCEALTNTSPFISFKSPSVIKIQTNSVSPEEWQDFSHKNIEGGLQDRAEDRLE
jgi:tektin-1